MTSVPSQPPEPQGHLVLLRHGETEWSKSGQHTGLTDLPLLPEGEEAARRVADLLSGWTFARVLVSPLQRARRTAELAGLTEYEIDPRLKEWDYGGYEGLTTKEIRSRVGYMWTVFENGVVPGDTPGETVESVAARAASVLWDIMPTLQDSNVALVAHGHYLRILATVFLRQEVRMGAKLLLGSASSRRSAPGTSPPPRAERHLVRVRGGLTTVRSQRRGGSTASGAPGTATAATGSGSTGQSVAPAGPKIP